MPNLTQKAYTQNLQLSRSEGYTAGRHAGREELKNELRVHKLLDVTDLMREAAALAQANAKLTYSLHLLVEKAAKHV